jgi:hypothetical protein
MKDFLKQITSRGGLVAAIMLLAFIVASNDALSLARGGKPRAPQLSLTGTKGSFSPDWYPDGRIWLPVASNGEREFLLPVFIDNYYDTRVLLTSTNRDTIPVVVDPIKSFRFKVFYNSKAVRVVGIQTSNPLDNKVALAYEPLAQGFNVTWSDSVDFGYLRYIKGSSVTPSDFQNGRSVVITGSSDKPLATTIPEVFPQTVNDLANNFKVLLYVRFRVVPRNQADVASFAVGNTPIYIAPDTIMYNDWNVSKDPILKKYRESDPTGYANYVAANNTNPLLEFTANAANYSSGLEGIDNSVTIVSRPFLAPCPPGTIYVRFFSNQPRFGFKSSRAIDPSTAIVQLPNNQGVPDPSNWEVLTPLTVDAKQGSSDIAVREVEVENVTSSTRLNDVIVESDSRWLKFRTKPGPGSKNVIASSTRRGYINWLDNGILGTSGGVVTEYGDPVPAEGKLFLQVECDPRELPAAGPGQEREGIYVGYLTFKSPFADLSPVRLKITFIYFKTPNEGIRAGVNPGVKLLVRNSKQGGSEQTRLIFGTGPRATDLVDTLYGEYPYNSANFLDNPSTFGARFFIRGNNIDAPFGLGDFAKDDINFYSSSRDIRSDKDTAESNVYFVRFNAGGDANYPVTLEWDVRDFPDGSNFFLKDDLNGKGFQAVDMRKSTATGQFTRSYIIQDPKINSFLIEYTPAKVVEYVDEKGNPIIKKGWNLLSMPVLPTNTEYRNVYVNAQNEPYAFYLGGYQQRKELVAGAGYFVKYGNNIDKQFAGSVIREISNTSGNAYRVWPGDAGRGGWNTIGSLSVPTNISNIDFELFGTSLPSKNYTLKFGVWGYNTNNGYYEVSEIKPGLGYFIKVDTDGYLKLTAPDGPKENVAVNETRKNIYKTSTVINIKDNETSASKLYVSNNKEVNVGDFELPPFPPLNLFDVRFETNTNLTNTESSIIRLQGVTYPVSINVENAKADYTFIDALTGQVFGSIAKGEAKTIEVASSSNNIKVVATESNDANVAFTNNPNPATTTTTFEYNVAQDGEVSLEIFNQTGGLVKTLVNGFEKAGSKTFEFNVSELSSGSYVVRYKSNGLTYTRTLTVVK